jgi:hypothetical protein
MEPAATIIKELGGPSEVSRICGVHRTRVSNWMRPSAAGGTGGVIPQKHHRAIINAWRERHIDRSAEDLLPIDKEVVAPPFPNAVGAA